jgi:hypothetical protein
MRRGSVTPIGTDMEGPALSRGVRSGLRLRGSRVLTKFPRGWRLGRSLGLTSLELAEALRSGRSRRWIAGPVWPGHSTRVQVPPSFVPE